MQRPSPSVLIVGAGAAGIVLGYHLSIGGCAVTFLVRPARREAMRLPQWLYCYDDGLLKHYSGFDVVTTAAEVAERQIDFLLLTPDATACRSADGTRLLQELGEAFRNTTTSFVMLAVGLGLREHVLTTTGLPAERLLEGTLGNAAHQTSAALLQHPPTDPALVAKASIAYRHFPNRVGFMLVPAPRAAAKRFAAIYDRCGVSRCTLLNAAIYRIYTNAFFCFTVTSELLGWPDAAALSRAGPMLSLCVRAARDIVGLSQFGVWGKAAGLMLSEKALLKMIGRFERDLRPLDFCAFNRFHHGDKVLAQDIEVLRVCLREGQSQGRSMASLGELLGRYDAALISRTRSVA